MKRLAALLVNDAKSALRDDIMVIVACVPVFLALLLRFGEPHLQLVLAGVVDLTPHHPVAIAVLTSMIPMMFGWVVGFMLLDDRDEQTLTAIAVTPLTKRGYLFYKTAMVTVLSFALSIVLIPLTGLTGLDYARFLPVAAVASLEAPIIALILAAFAGNKVEGLAVAKFISLLGLLPILPFYIDSPFVYIAGVTPFFWTGEALSHIASPLGPYLLPAAAGLVVHLLAFVLLLRVFARRVE